MDLESSIWIMEWNNLKRIMITINNNKPHFCICHSIIKLLLKNKIKDMTCSSSK
jgi:hypothetical protein